MQCIYNNARVVNDVGASFDIYQSFYGALAGMVGFMAIYRLTGTALANTRLNGGLRAVFAVMFMLASSIVGAMYCDQLTSDLYQNGGRADLLMAAVETNHDIGALLHRFPSGVSMLSGTVRGLVFGS